jgi:hypothetical protein
LFDIFRNEQRIESKNTKTISKNTRERENGEFANEEREQEHKKGNKEKRSIIFQSFTQEEMKIIIRRKY